MKQSDIVQQLSSADLKKSVLYTQLLIFSLSVILSLFLFNTYTDWFKLFTLNLSEIFYYGVIPAFIIILINIILDEIIPKRFVDDGGINEKLFSGQSIFSIFTIAATVAIAEELLFRGVIQSTFGYVFASLLFALIHIRYLTKPILLFAVIGMSFYIGYLFEVTQNLNVTIMAHFFIDFILGLLIKYKTRGERNGRRD